MEACPTFNSLRSRKIVLSGVAQELVGEWTVPIHELKERESQELLPKDVHPSVHLAKIYYLRPASGRITLGICFEVESALVWP